ncbi:MAG: hypothetical protein WC942_09255 [Clostridia bacterium]|jgi:hypothetical protein
MAKSTEWMDMTLPYNHNGRWSKKIKSIFNPQAMVTWPQFIAECVIFWRSKIIKTFPKITYGPGWSDALARQVRQLNQQAATICNYFPHPDDEPLVYSAFKNYIRANRVMKIGQYRKVRTTKDGKCNITQDEKDVVKGIAKELLRLTNQRAAVTNAATKNKTQTTEPIFKKSSGSASIFDKLKSLEG